MCYPKTVVAVSVNVSRFPFANWQALVSAINLVCCNEYLLNEWTSLRDWESLKSPQCVLLTLQPPAPSYGGPRTDHEPVT